MTSGGAPTKSLYWGNIIILVVVNHNSQKNRDWTRKLYTIIDNVAE